jgi:hypothetical protein
MKTQRTQSFFHVLRKNLPMAWTVFSVNAVIKLF